MSTDFDPYREWLGIKTPQRPPNYYQLLDLKLYESSRERIENAEMIQMAKVLRHESGPHAALAAQIGRELEAAVRCLCDPIDKAAYDADLFVSKSAQVGADDFVVSTAAVEQRQQATQPQESYEPPAIEPQETAEAAASVEAEEESFEDETAAPAEASAGGKSYDFASDLKLGDEEEVDDFSADLKLPETTQPEVAPLPAAPAVASWSAPPPQEEEQPMRPSFMEMLEKPAKGKEPAKGRKEKESAAEKPKAVYDPPPIPKKPLLPAFTQAQLSAKQIGILAAVAVVALAVWLVPQFYHPGPNPTRILAMLDASDPQTRITGIDSLRVLDLDPKETCARLVRILKEDQVEDVRLAAINALMNSSVTPDQVNGELKPLLAKETQSEIKAKLQWLVDQFPGNP